MQNPDKIKYITVGMISKRETSPPIDLNIDHIHIGFLGRHEGDSIDNSMYVWCSSLMYH